jgi:hypothetical protein
MGLRASEATFDGYLAIGSSGWKPVLVDSNANGRGAPIAAVCAPCRATGVDP